MEAPRQLPFGPVYRGLAGSQPTDTSRAAAAKVTLTIALRQSIVLAALKRIGPSTGDELMAHLKTTNPNAVRPRLTELRKLGMIRDTGARRPTPSGGTAIVWEPIR